MSRQAARRTGEKALMVRAVLFDLFETLITECHTRPAGVSSLAPELGCDRAAFRSRLITMRPAVLSGRLSFRQALDDIAAALGGHAEDATLQRMCDDRIRLKREPFAHIEDQILLMLDDLRRRGLRIAIVSNCCAEDVTAWPGCSLASRVDGALFSFEAGLAKPHPEIYVEATRRLRVDVSEAWFIGDGGDGELAGAERAGLRALRAMWFPRRWPHSQDQPPCTADLESPADVVNLLTESAARSTDD
jgi:FMN phosphatase YigB (HAD superfamily)